MLMGMAAVVGACGSNNPSATFSASNSGSTTPSILPLLDTAELRAGSNRMIYTLVDSAQQHMISGPTRTLTAAYAGPGGESIPASATTFIWAVQDVNGVYIGHTTFPSEGQWTAHLTTESSGSPGV
jgi:hypothetical protein